MKLPSTKTLVANVACLVVLGWLYGGDLMDALQARGAEVSAFLEPPRVGWPAGVLVATVGVLGVVAWGLWRGRGEDFKGYRLLPILLVSALFVDLMFSESQLPMPPTDVAVLSLRHFQQQAQALASEKAVPADPAVLRPLLDELGEPPYLVRGTRVGAWSLQVRENCEGPIAEAPGAQVGTLLYCVSPGRERAWITLVGLEAGARFGVPVVLSVGGEPHYALVRTVGPEPSVEEVQGDSLPFQAIPGMVEGAEGKDGR
jgi:hypothetical protein